MESKEFHLKRFSKQQLDLGRKEALFSSYLSQRTNFVLSSEVSEQKDSLVIKTAKMKANLTEYVLQGNKIGWLPILIVKAVKQLHKLKITHGDIKPDNFLVNGKELKIIDFETCSLNGKLANFDLKRTISYCKYQDNSESRDLFENDLYSLGLTLYFVVSRRMIERKPTEMEISDVKDDRLRFVIKHLLEGSISLFTALKVLKAEVPLINKQLRLKLNQTGKICFIDWVYSFSHSANSETIDNSLQSRLVLSEQSSLPKRKKQVEEFNVTHLAHMATLKVYLPPNSKLEVDTDEEDFTVEATEANIHTFYLITSALEKTKLKAYYKNEQKTVSIGLNASKIVKLYQSRYSRFILEDSLVHLTISATLS